MSFAAQYSTYTFPCPRFARLLVRTQDLGSIWFAKP